MIRFVFGVLLGAAIAGGGGWLWIERSSDCVRRCGDDTVCFSGRCMARHAPTEVVAAPGKETRARRR